MEGHELMLASESMEIRMYRAPDAVIAEMQMVANALRKQAEKLELYKKIGPSKHLLVEGWQICGQMFRVATRLRETKYIEYGQARGFECTVEAYHIPTGQIVGVADAMCLSDEDNWGTRPKYEYVNGQREKTADVMVPLQQLRSMAQTRAQSKVYSTLFKAVARMAGFAPTPGEEMTGEESGNGAPSQPQRKAQQQGGGEGCISEQQAKRLYAIGMKAFNNDKNAFNVFLKSKGYENSRQIKTSDYDAIVAQAEKGGAPAQAPNPEHNRPISADAKLRIWQVAAECGWSKEEVLTLIKRAGFNSEDEITVAKLPDLIETLRGGSK